MNVVSMPRGPQARIAIDPCTLEPMKPLRSATAIRFIVNGIGILVMVGAIVRGWL